MHKEKLKLFHAHVYFKDPEEREAAMAFWMRALYFRSFCFSEMVSKKIGPHPLPMVEIHFVESEVIWARKWLQANRGDFSVLIHRDTGDDVKDHTENIEWLGQPYLLDFNFFELIKTNPELRVHK
jgi:aromatic ring-cleaving dioxygenase